MTQKKIKKKKSNEMKSNQIKGVGVLPPQSFLAGLLSPSILSSSRIRGAHDAKNACALAHLRASQTLV
jgi:hypothetical protein